MRDRDHSSVCVVRGGRVATAALDLAVGFATIAGIWLVARHAVEFGSRRGNWVFAYLADVDARLLVIACVAAVLVALLHEIGRRTVDASPAPVVSEAFVSGVLAQIGIGRLAAYSVSPILL